MKLEQDYIGMWQDLMINLINNIDAECYRCVFPIRHNMGGPDATYVDLLDR